MQFDNASKPLLEVGTWIGRRQAFGLMASKCSFADAASLKYLREGRQYKEAGMTWDEFCTRHLGISKTHADRIISQLDEFGKAYFALSEIVRIPAEAFREIASSVSDHSIEYNGQTIPIKKENAHKIADVIRGLREEAAQNRLRTDPPTTPPRVKNLQKLRHRLDTCLTGLAAIAHSSLHPDDRAEVVGLICAGQDRLEQLSQALRPQLPPA
jgi:hypothetical protein